MPVAGGNLRGTDDSANFGLAILSNYDMSQLFCLKSGRLC